MRNDKGKHPAKNQRTQAHGQEINRRVDQKIDQRQASATWVRSCQKSSRRMTVENAAMNRPNPYARDEQTKSKLGRMGRVHLVERKAWPPIC
jgi:hypothetical protein